MARSKVLALILAGGEGGRLEVLTEQRAKPAMPFAGVYRLIDFSLSNCMHSGLSDVWVVEQYQPHSLNEHLANGRPWDLDRTYGGLQVLPPYASRQDEGGFAAGNADAIYRQRTFIRDFAPDLLLVLSADHIYKLDFRDVIEHHLELKADVTMVTTKAPGGDASRYGTIKAGRGGRVTFFEYKPDEPQSDLITTEVFVYNAARLMDTLDNLAAGGKPKKKARGKSPKGDQGNGDAPLKDFGHELLPQFVSDGRAFEYRFEGYWRDVGTVESYWQSHMDLLAPEPPLALDDPRWPILTYGNQSLPARVAAAARIENSLISPGCIVRGHVSRSILAPGVVVAEGATVRDSIILHNTVIEAEAVIDCAVVDEGVHVGKRAKIGAPAEKPKGKPRTRRSAATPPPKIALIGRNLQIKAGAHVGDDARLKPKDNRQ